MPLFLTKMGMLKRSHIAKMVLLALALRAGSMCQAQGLRSGLGPDPAALGFEMEYVRPELHRWYLPRNQFETYAKPWYIADTRYARDLYRHYLSTELEGEQWYDKFGRPLERGWLLYEWNQVQEDPKGSSIWKAPEYGRLFQRLLVASDGGRYGDYRLMVGDQFYTMFTPLTFNKPRFSGMRMDYAADRYRASLLLSRPSMPDQDVVSGTLRPSARADFTNLIGGHTEFQLTSAASLGLTYVNAHHGNTKEEFGAGSPFGGNLTTDQNQPLKTLWVRLRDDSPTDGRGGPLLVDYDIVLTDTSGLELRGREIGFLPTVEGGIARGSARAADGSEMILLTYDLSSLDYDLVQTADLRQVRVELSLANDYHVEIASDRQNDGESRRAQPVFLTASRAEGNVQDNSNATVLQIDYGLPTATEVIGINWNLSEWKGLSMQGEVAIGRRHRQYPNPGIADRHRAVARAEAAYLQAAYNFYPWSLFVEGFSIADGYSTSAWLSSGDGKVRYDDPTKSLYELVDDDDDFNAVPEWVRLRQPSRDAAWPGYDENRDFLHDYNQNHNLFPDYEEPFLRFRSDRPEFLPGLDMNHNGTIDRLENDEYPDYPYRQDHRGFNAYGAVHLAPEAVLTLGHQRIRLISGDGRSRSLYGLMRGVWLLPGQGRLRLFDHLSRVRDNIADPLRLWIQAPGLAGKMRDVPDLLPAQNTWTNAAYAELSHLLGPSVRFLHRLRWDLLWQLDDLEDLRQREARQRAGFFGLIDKVEWSIPVGLAVFEPRFKNEYRRERPFSRRRSTAESLEETLFLLWTQPLFAEHVAVGYFPRYGRQLFSTELQLGLELSWFHLLEGKYEEVEGDFSSWFAVAQLINRSAYQGYQLITRVGLEVGRRRFEQGPNEQRNMFFMTINAGLE